MDDTINVCEWCGQQLDPDAHDVVHAVEVHYVRTFTESQELEGLGVYFHRRCYPERDPSYRRASGAAR